MKILIKLRIFIVLVILVLNLLLLPNLLLFLQVFKEYGFQAPRIFLQSGEFLQNVLQVKDNKNLFEIWVYFQPGVLFLMYMTLFGRRKKHYAADGLGGPEAAGRGQFGTSRWLSEKELDKLSTPWVMREVPGNSDTIIPPQVPANPFDRKCKELKVAGGVVLGMDIKKNKAWLDTQDSNTLIIGTSRSGKSRTFLLPSIWAMAHGQESMVITDPKGEIYRMSNQMLKEKGYDIVLLDFREPGRSRRWNPMYQIIKGLEQGDQAIASDAAWDLAHNLVMQKGDEKESVWTDGQQSVIAALALAVSMDAPKTSLKNMTSVYENLVELGKVEKVMVGPTIQDFIRLNYYFENLPQGHIAKRAYATAALSPEKMRGSFFSNTLATLRLFSDPGISYITAEQDHDLAGVGKRPTAVYIVVPDEKTTKHVLASLYVNQTYQALIQLASENNDRIPVRTNFLLDEFGNMPTIPDFDNKVTASLGRGIRWHLIIQDFQQMRKKYSDSTDTIKGNCHTWVYLLTTDPKTAEEISKKTGKYTVQTESYSSSSQDKRGVSHGQSEALTGRSLLTPDEILRWPVEQSLVFRARSHPVRLPLPDISKWKDAAIKMNPNTERGRYVGVVSAEVYLLQNNSNQEISEEEETIF